MRHKSTRIDTTCDDVTTPRLQEQHHRNRTATARPMTHDDRVDSRIES
jgi:hypothetical protein